MVAPIGVGSASLAHFARTPDTEPETDETGATRGKSAESPAHQAKAAIAAATDLGDDIPANIHGKVTSSIARGEFIDISSLLILQSDEPAATEATDDGTDTSAVGTGLVDGETTEGDHPELSLADALEESETTDLPDDPILETLAEFIEDGSS